MERDKSISRAKKSTIRVSDLLLKEGAAALVPGGGLIYDAGKALLQHGKQYFKDRTEIRLDEFYQAILTGDFKEGQFEQFLDKEFDLDDYSAVLASCVQDVEDEKTRIYSQLMQSLIMGVIETKLRRHFITSSKDLTFQELCFLRDIYINSKFDLMTVGGTSQQVENLLSTSDVFKDLIIGNLISRAFIHKNKTGLTHIGEQYIETIFQKSELKPESIGRKPWTGINIVIISYQLGDQQNSAVCMIVQEALWQINIKSSIHILDKRPTTSMFYGAGVLIIGDKKIESSYLKAVEEFSKKKPLVRLNLNEESCGIDLREINFVEEFTLKSATAPEIRNEVNDYISKILPQNDS